jgi:hypothetical protein
MNKPSITLQREYVNNIARMLVNIVETTGSETVDTFDKNLANHLRTVSGACNNALSYMKERCI